MSESQRFLGEHGELTRRFFLRCGATWAAAACVLPVRGAELPPELSDAVAKIEPYFTPPREFRDVSRGKPVPHTLSEDKKREVGLTRETWKLEVVSDPEHPATLGQQLTKKDGTAIEFADVLRMGETRAVRFAK